MLAQTIARPAKAVHSSIDPDVQRAADAAKGARLGGVAAVRPRTGEILALAGIAFSGLQPPGSTFKIITLTGVLEHKLAGPNSVYPVADEGGRSPASTSRTPTASPAAAACACRSRTPATRSSPRSARGWGPSGSSKTAEEFGFNTDPGIPGAATSTIPKAGEIGDGLAVGSSAIGQGRVQATALQMAWVAATIAGRGKRPRLTLERGLPEQRKQVVDAGVARMVGRFMEAVVNEGTGGAAKISNVRVAGKTGTAELRDTSHARLHAEPRSGRRAVPAGRAQRPDRHRCLVCRLRARRRAARRGRGAARRGRRGRRHGGAGRQAGARRGPQGHAVVSASARRGARAPAA